MYRIDRTRAASSSFGSVTASSSSSALVSASSISEAFLLVSLFLAPINQNGLQRRLTTLRDTYLQFGEVINDMNAEILPSGCPCPARFGKTSTHMLLRGKSATTLLTKSKRKLVRAALKLPIAGQFATMKTTWSEVALPCSATMPRSQDLQDGIKVEVASASFPVKTVMWSLMNLPTNCHALVWHSCKEKHAEHGIQNAQYIWLACVTRSSNWRTSFALALADSFSSLNGTG